MNKHAKSLTLSLLIHTLLLIVIYFVYTKTSKYFMPAQKTQRVCIKLNAVVDTKREPQKQSVKKQEDKSITKPKTVKTSVKKIEKAKTIKKKKIPKKETPKRVKKHPIEKIQKQEKEVTVSKIPTKVVKSETLKLCEPTEPTEQTKAKVLVKQKTAKEKYIEKNLEKIARLIQENLYYPRRARKRGIEGVVVVRFTLHEDGVVTQIATTESSSGILTRAAIKTIAELSGDFPKPAQRLVISVPINYSLH